MSDLVLTMINRGRGKGHAGVKQRIQLLGELNKRRTELVTSHAWCFETARVLAEEYIEKGLKYTPARILREFDVK